MPTLYIIAGCNGAGKTTASMTLLPEILNCKEFVNADSIAAGLSPFHPEGVSFEAGRLMLQRMEYLISQKETFAIETTLTTISYRNTIAKSKTVGYEVTLIYFWLNNVDLALQRIAHRVKKGGHNVSEDVVKRRYSKGISNFIKIFAPIVNSWMVFDNSGKKPVLVAEHKLLEKIIHHQKLWNNFLENDI